MTKFLGVVLILAPFVCLTGFVYAVGGATALRDILIVLSVILIGMACFVGGVILLSDR